MQYGYRIERLQQEKQQVLEANRKLRLEEASLGDPVRIGTIARNQMGMTVLSPAQIVNGEASSLVPEVSVLAKVQAAPLPTQAKECCRSSALRRAAASLPDFYFGSIECQGI